MGGDLAIKEKLRAVWAGEAFQPSRYDHEGTYAIIDDFLVTYKGIPTVDCSYTLVELFDRFWRNARYHLGLSHCDTYIMVCDDRSNVPKLKGETQAKRVEASAKSNAKNGVAEVEPYPVGTVFVNEGVKIPGAESEPEPICLRRLARSRWYGPKEGAKWSNLGNDLWFAFHPMIEAAMKEIAPGRTFIFDHVKEGPYIFDHGQVAVHATQLAHDLGEADPALVWWTHQLGKDRPTLGAVHWETTDTDLIALYALYHGQVEKRTKRQYQEEDLFVKPGVRPVYWHCERDVMVDMPLMARMIMRNTKFQTLACFAMGFILAGCDIMHKARYAHRFGMMFVFDAVASVDVSQVGTAHAIFEQFLLNLYRDRLAGGKLTVPEAHRKPASVISIEAMRQRLATKKKTPSKFPSHEETKWQAERFRFNYKYWMGAIEGKRPLVEPVMTSELQQERSVE